MRSFGTAILLAVALYISGAATNLLTNQCFDDGYTGNNCTSISSWSQVNASNPATNCPPYPLCTISEPAGLYMVTTTGVSGVQQTVVLNQQVAYGLNFTAWIRLVSCTEQTCYTTINFFGVRFFLNYQDGTNGTFEIAYAYGSTTATFVFYSNEFIPERPVNSLTIQLILDGNGMATAMWDDVSLVMTTTAPSTPTPSTPAPSTPAPSTPAPSTPAPSTPAPSTSAPSTSTPTTEYPTDTASSSTAAPTPTSSTAPPTSSTASPTPTTSSTASPTTTFPTVAATLSPVNSTNTTTSGAPAVVASLIVIFFCLSIQLL